MISANDNRLEVPAGHSYYPEMGETAPKSAIFCASLSHGGRHYYIKFSEADRKPVMDAIASAKVRYSREDRFVSCITGEAKVTIMMTAGAYDKLRKMHKALCTSEMLLD